MSLLRRLRGRRAPAWASFFTGAEHERFVAVVHADMAARGWAFTQHEDGIVVDRPSLPTRWEFGLANLAQRCHLAPEEAWSDLVREHFDGILVASEASADAKASWQTARPLLKLRLFGPDTELPDGIVTFPVAHDLVAALALDLPTTVDTLQREDVADWPPADELYRIALDNVRAEPLPATDVLGSEPGVVTVLAGDSFFVATRLLLLAESVDLAGASGALVAVPNRHVLLVHPIVHQGVVRALSALVTLAAGLYRDGPGSIVPTVYWWHAGALTAIEARDDGREVVVTPPDAFIELLETLDPAPGA